MKTNKYGVVNLSVQLLPKTVQAFRRLAKANGQSASSRGRMLILRDLAVASAAAGRGNEEGDETTRGNGTTGTI